MALSEDPQNSGAPTKVRLKREVSYARPMDGEVVHFEVPAKDLKRAKAFYSKVFGWKLTDVAMEGGEPYVLAVTTELDEKGNPTRPGSINGGMMVLEKPFTGPSVTLKVGNITSALRDIEKNGGKTVIERTSLGPVGFVGYFRDPEGNVMGLFEPPKE